MCTKHRSSACNTRKISHGARQAASLARCDYDISKHSTQNRESELACLCISDLTAPHITNGTSPYGIFCFSPAQEQPSKPSQDTTGHSNTINEQRPCRPRVSNNMCSTNTHIYIYIYIKYWAARAVDREFYINIYGKSRYIAEF